MKRIHRLAGGDFAAGPVQAFRRAAERLRPALLEREAGPGRGTPVLARETSGDVELPDTLSRGFTVVRNRHTGILLSDPLEVSPGHAAGNRVPRRTEAGGYS